MELSLPVIATWVFGSQYSKTQPFARRRMLQRNQKILSRQRFVTKDQQFDFNLWPCHQKIKREHLFSRGNYSTKFVKSKAKGLKTLNGQLLYKDQQSDLELLTNCDLKISREHLLSRDHHCTKIDNSQAEGSKDIEWDNTWSTDWQIDWQVQTENWLSCYNLFKRNTIVPILSLRFLD